jgi:hypothetical protein
MCALAAAEGGRVDLGGGCGRGVIHGGGVFFRSDLGLGCLLI